MQARIDNMVSLLPGALEGVHAVTRAANQSGIPQTTIEMAVLRASQINGCSVCVQLHGTALRKAGESDERIWGVAAWRDAPYYSDPERAALALAESITRIADSSDPVPDAVYDEAAKHFDETQLASLILHIAMINTYNRLNAATRQVAGAQW